MIYPVNFEEKIDFLTVRRLLSEKCMSNLGREWVEKLEFSSNYAEISVNLDQTDELIKLLNSTDETLPVGDFFDLRQGLARIRVEGLFLDEKELFELRRALEAVRRLVDFIARQDDKLFPHLIALIQDVAVFPQIIKEIDSILDKFGKIKDHASHELARIRKEMNQVQNSVSRSLMSILKQAQLDGYVDKDVAPTMREGRLVIPVSPAFKRKINGIVHDESATGKTVFIEPSQVVEANNRIRELEGEERREVMRILVLTTDYLRPFVPEIVSSQEFLGRIDFIHAKSVFAAEIQAIRPRMDPVSQLEWERAKHPLLYLNLKKQKKEVVPLDIYLNDKQRILLISGPNAGGKSVCLKTVVLLQYMLQCGLLVPVHENSRCGTFDNIFIDIGDEQSIENDLSTYSSHLMNMKHFVRYSNAKTLILIDEFGTGTEPMIGGAIAEATLDRFNRKAAFGVITTHYTNLKHFAEDAEGIVNGAMLYDRQHLQPLFQLQIGNPGSSFAVEIARKIGLPEDLILEAAQKVGAEHLDYDKHLQDIVRDKRYWENKRQQIRLKEKKMDEILSKYQSEIDLINQTKKEILNKAKQDASLLMSQANAKIENTIREIRENQAEKEKTKQSRSVLEEFKSKLKSNEGADIQPKLKVIKPKQEVPQKMIVDELKVGDLVRLKDQTAVGDLLEIQGKQAVVAFGQLKSTVKLLNLVKVSRNQLKKEGNKYENLGRKTTDEVRQRKLHFKSDIDIRGMRADEALQAVTYFVDDAIMVGVETVKILHGTGTGALRQLIRQYLATVHGVKKFRDEHVQFGGTGITVVEFEI